MDNLDFGIRVSVLGFSTVIITLFILYLIMLLFTRLSNGAQRGKDNVAPEEMDIVFQDGIEPAVAAALTVAITSYLELTGRRGTAMAVTVGHGGEPPRSGWVSAVRRMNIEGKLEIERLRRKRSK